MGYLIKITQDEWNSIRKEEQYVYFLSSSPEFNILKGGTLYFSVNENNHNVIVGEASIQDTVDLDINKLRNIEIKSEQYIDMRDAQALNTKTDLNSANCMNALNRGFEKRNKNKLYSNTKNNSKDFYQYVADIGFADSKEDAEKFDIRWSCAICFDNVKENDSKTPTEFFGNLEKPKKILKEIANLCLEKTGTYCYQCPYVGTCLRENVNIIQYPLKKIEKEIYEVQFIRPTHNGL